MVVVVLREILPSFTCPGNRPEARLRTVGKAAFPIPEVRSPRVGAAPFVKRVDGAGCRSDQSGAASSIRWCRRDSLRDRHSGVDLVDNGQSRRHTDAACGHRHEPSVCAAPGADRPTAAVRPGRDSTARAVRVGGKSATQKYVVAVVLVSLSQVIVTVQFRNRGTAGTILRSYLELAGKAKLRLKPSVAYVHCDDTPLRSVM